MPSDELLRALPTIERTRDLTRSLAVLDAVMSPDWESRYYSFDASWGADAQMASMRNGSGDEWFCWLGPAGAAIVGFDHESSMSPYAAEPQRLWPGLADGLPSAFEAPVLREPAFMIDDTTFLIWREPGDEAWRCGPVEPPPGEPEADGAGWLLELLLTDDPQAYVDFAAEYYECEVPIDAVRAVWQSQPLTDEIVRALNPEVTLAAIRDDVAAGGYPLAD